MSKRLFQVLIFILIIPSCYTFKGKEAVDQSGGPSFELRKAAILPFMRAQRDPVFSDLVFCPLTGYRTKMGFIERGAEEKLYNALRASLEKEGIQLVSELSVMYAINEAKDTYSSDELKRIASLLDVDALFGGCILRFEERVGKSYGAERGASVSFTVVIWKFPESMIVWSSYFDETQVPLTENLLQLPIFIRGGYRWISADELMKQGVSRIVESIPLYKR